MLSKQESIKLVMSLVEHMTESSQNEEMGEIRETTPHHPYIIGENYLIRTVTFFHIGRLVDVFEQELVLTDASWIADTGRFHDCLIKGELNDVEPFLEGRVVVGRGAVIDACIWNHELPKEQK